MRSIYLCLICFLTLFAACNSTSEAPAEETPKAVETKEEVRDNKLTDTEKGEGWKLLFDGFTTRGWHNFRQDSVAGWVVEEGALVSLGAGKGDLLTDAIFKNFELSIEWKISKGGNSGIMYNVVESEAYESTYATGPEYQVLDDKGYKEKLKPSQYSGANYDMHPPTKRVTKPAGEYNQTTIKMNNGQVEHWLNGEKVVEYQLWTKDWEQLVQGSKWKDYPAYGRAPKGRLALQDHGDKVWYKNIKIKNLDISPAD